MTKHYFITGANRGIGLELVKQLLEQGHKVSATCRNLEKSTDLVALKDKFQKQLNVLKLEVTDANSIKACLDQIDQVDIVLNNAGMLAGYQTSIEDVDLAEIRKTFEVNTMAPIAITKQILPKLNPGAKLFHMSSKVGSIAENTSGFAYSYRISKTALNMFNKSLSINLKPKGFSSIVLHPGWVQTDMGGDQAPTTQAQSAAGLIQVMNSKSIDQTGEFFDFEGKSIPW